MIIQYDLAEDVLAIARALAGGGRLVSRYSSPAWSAELTRADGTRTESTGPTASQAIAALGKRLRGQERRS